MTEIKEATPDQEWVERAAQAAYEHPEWGHKQPWKSNPWARKAWISCMSDVLASALTAVQARIAGLEAKHAAAWEDAGKKAIELENAEMQVRRERDEARAALTLVRDRFFPADQPERDRDRLWEPVNRALSPSASAVPNPLTGKLSEKELDEVERVMTGRKAAVLGGDQTGAIPSTTEERVAQVLLRVEVGGDVWDQITDKAREGFRLRARRFLEALPEFALSHTQPEGGE